MIDTFFPRTTLFALDTILRAKVNFLLKSEIFIKCLQRAPENSVLSPSVLVLYGLSLYDYVYLDRALLMIEIQNHIKYFTRTTFWPLPLSTILSGTLTFGLS